MVTEKIGAKEHRSKASKGKKNSNLPITGKKALVLKKKIATYDSAEQKSARQLEENHKRLKVVAQKLNTTKEDKYNTKHYRKLAHQYDQLLKKKEGLVKKNTADYKRLSKVTKEYHSALGANYHVKARALNQKIIQKELEQEKLNEKHKVNSWEGEHYQNTYGHTTRYQQLYREIKELKKRKEKLERASDSHREVAGMYN